MKSYIQQLSNLLIRLFVLLCAYSVARLFFFIVNYNVFENNPTFNLVKIFLFGPRFDFVSVVMLNLWFIVLYILPFNFANNKRYLKIVGYFFFIYNFLLLLVNFTDAEYFKFIGKRTTADIFGYIFMSDDVARLMPQFLKDFWYIGLIWILCCFTTIWVSNKLVIKKIAIHKFNFKNWVSAWLLFLLVSGLLFIGARGIGLKPVRIISAAHYTETHNIPLLLNSPFTILHTIGNDVLKPIVYFDEKNLNSIYSPEHQYSNRKPKRDNVIIIILESFSKEFVGSLNNGKGYTPNLDNIINNGLVFDNAFANGKRSIEAVPAALAGLPALTDESYISSRFSGNQLLALPNILSKNGYHTSFFHGGHNGTMGFDEFARVSGISNYYGLKEYEGPEAYNGNWGIDDEHFLKYYADKLNTFQTPFFSTVFTLSSHHPYKLPAVYKDSFSDAPNDLLKSIRYADISLGKFFKNISSMPWYKNTLFILMADHTTTEQSSFYGTTAGMYRIPLVFYQPGDTAIKGIDHRIAQQADIMPSVIDYLGIKIPFVAFGNSVFDPSAKSFSVSFLSGIYHYFQNDYLLTFDGEKTIGLFNFKTDNMLNLNIAKDSIVLRKNMEIQLKSVIQQYNSRLLKNKMTSEKNILAKKNKF